MGVPCLSCPLHPQLVLSYPGEMRWLRDYCASGLYILTLLLDGYGFSEHTWPTISFRKQVTLGPGAAPGGRAVPLHATDHTCVQVGDADIGWTLGYMLNQTNRIPAELPARWLAQRHGVWVASVVWAVLTLLTLLGAAASQLLAP